MSDKGIWVVALALVGLFFTVVMPPVMRRILVPPRPTEAGQAALRKGIVGALVAVWIVLAVLAIAVTPGSHAG